MDAPGVDVPGVDAPGVDAPGVDAPGVDAPRVLPYAAPVARTAVIRITVTSRNIRLYLLPKHEYATKIEHRTPGDCIQRGQGTFAGPN
ncbi:MAG: hypothetical protein CMD83_18720 [Gammaproteobacteria bacterium]|nr:hypothetical protein [Gammaproteobacteria bacterium]